MKKNNIPNDDLDMWEDVLSHSEPQKHRQPQKSQPQSHNDDWYFVPEDTTSKKTRTTAKKRSPLPLILAVLAVCLAAVVFLQTTSPFGEDTAPSDPPVLYTEPAPIPTVYLEPAVVATQPPVHTDPVVEPVPPPAETVPVETAPPARDPATYRFYGRRLTDYGRELYDRIAAAVCNFETVVPDIQVQTLEDLEPVVLAVFYDYAEYFWFTGQYTYTYYDRDGYFDLILTPHYFWDIPTCQRNAAFVEQTVDSIIAPLYWVTDYEKVRYVYEYLVDHTAYDYDYMGKTIYEQLYEGGAVCAAYARTTQYMLTKLGIETIYVVGMGGVPGDLESHAWNIIKLDGDYYQYDATWGDPYYEDGTQEKNFHYLLITDTESDKRHFPDEDIFPTCNSIKYNYYVQEDRYLQFYDLTTLAQWIREGNQTDRAVEFKCANQWVYQDVVSYLLGQQAIFDLFNQAGCDISQYTYYNYDEYYIVRLEW